MAGPKRQSLGPYVCLDRTHPAEITLLENLDRFPGCLRRLGTSLPELRLILRSISNFLQQPELHRYLRLFSVAPSSERALSTWFTDDSSFRVGPAFFFATRTRCRSPQSSQTAPSQAHPGLRHFPCPTFKLMPRLCRVRLCLAFDRDRSLFSISLRTVRASLGSAGLVLAS